MRLLATAGDKVVTHVSGATGRHIVDTWSSLPLLALEFSVTSVVVCLASSWCFWYFHSRTQVIRHFSSEACWIEGSSESERLILSISDLAFHHALRTCHQSLSISGLAFHHALTTCHQLLSISGLAFHHALRTCHQSLSISGLVFHHTLRACHESLPFSGRLHCLVLWPIISKKWNHHTLSFLQPPRPDTTFFPSHGHWDQTWHVISHFPFHGHWDQTWQDITRFPCHCHWDQTWHVITHFPWHGPWHLRPNGTTQPVVWETLGDEGIRQDGKECGMTTGQSAASTLTTPCSPWARYRNPPTPPGDFWRQWFLDSLVCVFSISACLQDELFCF